MTKIKIINKSKNDLPKYNHKGDSGMDLRANLEGTIRLLPRRRLLVPTGIQIELPKGYEAQVRGRSGLAIKHGIGIVNGIGTIDSNYRGDIGVILINHGNEVFKIKNGDRIAQLVISKVENVEWEEVEILEETKRGENGYGSTGIED